MHEERENDDDRQRDAEKPEKRAFTQTHDILLCVVARKTPGRK
jgi:hypothetical protein